MDKALIKYLTPYYEDKVRSSKFLLGNPVSVDTSNESIVEFETSFDQTMEIGDTQLGRHMAVLGASGSGKSKYLEQFGRYLLRSGNGFTFIDPHGDTATALVEYAASLAKEYGDENIFPKFHYLEPRKDQLFSFDPLKIRDVNPEDGFAFEVDRDTAVQKLIRVILRSEAKDDEEKMRRLKRWLGNALTVIATPTDLGTAFSFGDLPAVLYPHHARFKKVTKLIAPSLSTMIKSDYEFLFGLNRPLDADHYLESTLNRITDVCSTMTRAIFGNQAPSFDFQTAIKERHCTIVNLKEAKSISREAGTPIADFIINEIRNVCAEFDEAGERTRHYLIIDEAGNYMADDLGDFLDEARKWQLSICLGAQHLSNFKKGNTDISGQVLGNCRTVISFQQRNLEDVESLGKFYAYPNLNLSELKHVTDRPDRDADEIVLMKSRSTSDGLSQTRSAGESKGKNEGKGIHISKAQGNAVTESENEGYSVGKQKFRSKGIGSAAGTGMTSASGSSAGMSPMMIDGNLIEVPIAGTQKAAAQNEQYSDSSNESEGEGESETRNKGKGTAKSLSEIAAQGESENTSKSKQDSIVNSFGRSRVISYSETETLRQGTREYWQSTGNPRFSLDLQYTTFEKLITVMPDQFAFLRSRVDGREQSFVFRVANVFDAFENAVVAKETRESFIKRLFATKEYIFVPRSPDEVLEERVTKILGHVEKSQNRDNPFGI